MRLDGVGGGRDRVEIRFRYSVVYAILGLYDNRFDVVNSEVPCRKTVWN